MRPVSVTAEMTPTAEGTINSGFFIWGFFSRITHVNQALNKDKKSYWQIL